MHYRSIAHAALPFRILIFFGLLALFWAPWASIIYIAGRLSNWQELASTFALVCLYVCFIVHAWFWARSVHDRRRPFRHYGLVFCDRFFQDIVIALLIGIGLVVCLFSLKIGLGWAMLTPSGNLATVITEGFAVGLGIGFAEELLFRGWLLTELNISLPRYQAIGWNGLLFAVAHFIKPIPEIIQTSPQFFGLLLLGLILGAGRYINSRSHSFTSLGLPIGLHAGLVWSYYIVDVGDLVSSSGTVPEWITGIHGNPLSGALGISILSILASMTWIKLHPK
ncbi:MAG: lysostaphin resistance A-like protein [Cyanobacteria bacterium P01_D01_bin.156]